MYFFIMCKEKIRIFRLCVKSLEITFEGEKSFKTKLTFKNVYLVGYNEKNL